MLDLGGNPCTSESVYKYRVIRALPRLIELDGDVVTALDKEMAEDLQAQAKGVSSIESIATPPPLVETKSSDSNVFASKAMPKGNVRLFRSNFLNTNPIMLEYLAKVRSNVENAI